MNLAITTCDECILEEIKKDIPNYYLEHWGYKPIWARYAKTSKKKLCVAAGDIEYESVCLEHLFTKEILR